MKIYPIITFAVLLLLVPLHKAAGADAVTLEETDAEYVMDNGIVAVRVAKASGDLVSMRFQNKEMLATFLKPDGTPDLEKDPPGFNHEGLNRRMTDHQYGFWSHDAMGLPRSGDAISRITIHPDSNDGDRAEVSVKGISEGRLMGTGPGAGKEGDFAADVEIRYSLGRGDSGVYTYSIFEHKSHYPTTSIAEARFCAKLNGFFDWMSIAEHLDMYFPKDMHRGDKYIFTALQSENPAFGWSSTTEKVGVFILNPSNEYMSGGPTKIEFLGHRDTNRIGAPCILNYWRSSHYGGAEVAVAEGEHWTKVVGPFKLFVTDGKSPEDIYAKARAQQKKEANAWPYDWVEGVDYPISKERATVSGKLNLKDPLAPKSKMSNIMVGLTPPIYQSPRPEGPSREVNWQIDAKHYQFWVDADPGGYFKIPDVRPGKYTLRAIADGVLGEFVKKDVVVEKGQSLKLGALEWTPQRYGPQVWEVGIPNRTSTEFLGAEDYADPEISLRYPELFPDDVTYVIGKSDFRKDWFFQHVPHNEDHDAKAMPYRGVVGEGRATPFTIVFDMNERPNGTATLRLAICGTGTRELYVAVNGERVGVIDELRGDGVITRHSVQGIWYEKELSFDASQLTKGENTLTVTVPAGRINDGIVYDYLRLELNEDA